MNIEEPQIDDLQIDEPPIIEEDDTHSTIGLEEDSTNTPIIPPSVSAQETTNAMGTCIIPKVRLKNVVDEDERNWVRAIVVLNANTIQVRHGSHLIMGIPIKHHA